MRDGEKKSCCKWLKALVEHHFFDLCKQRPRRKWKIEADGPVSAFGGDFRVTVTTPSGWELEAFVSQAWTLKAKRKPSMIPYFRTSLIADLLLPLAS